MCFDYSSERGYIIGHGGVLLRFLPDTTLSGCGAHLVPGADVEGSRSEVIRALGGRTPQVARNRDVRKSATPVFDRTFAITYAPEAVAVFVAFLGMAGAPLAPVIDRRAELGALQALGGSKSQVRSLVLTQAGMLLAAAKDGRRAEYRHRDRSGGEPSHDDHAGLDTAE